jgi:hypothetical protein
MSALVLGQVGTPSSKLGNITTGHASNRQALLAKRTCQEHEKNYVDVQVVCQAAVTTVLVPSEVVSPYHDALWREVFDLMAERFSWENLDLTLRVFTAEEAQGSGQEAVEFREACKRSDMFVAVGMHAALDAELVKQACQSRRPVTLVLDSTPVSPPNHQLAPGLQMSGCLFSDVCWHSSSTNCPENPVGDGVHMRHVQQWLAPDAAVIGVTLPAVPRPS